MATSLKGSSLDRSDSLWYVHFSANSSSSPKLLILSIDIANVIAVSRPHLHMDLANGVVVGARNIHPVRDVSVGSTGDVLDVNVASCVVVASLVAAVVDGAVGCALLSRDGVGKRHAVELSSQYDAQSIVMVRSDWLTIQGRR